MPSKEKFAGAAEVENLRNEVGALRRAVESKSAAIGILRTELEECQRERDEFRTIAEARPISLPLSSLKVISPCPEKTHSAFLSGSEGTLAQLLSQSKEESKQLKSELTDIRCKLHDAQSDLKVLREEKSRKTDIHQIRLSAATSSQLAQREREDLIQQLEEFSFKCQALERDLRCLLEEREELINERDNMNHKLHRLNHILNTLLSQDSLNQAAKSHHRTIDLDAVIIENRYLQQKLKQGEEEKSMALNSASKYKSALEKCRTNSSSLKLGSSGNLIVSSKQVSEFLQQHKGEIGENAERDLKSLCIALVDSLNEKSRAVKSQKTANKMLVGRVQELERRLGGSTKKVVNNECDLTTNITLASSSLMEGYIQPSGLHFTENLDSTKLIEKLEELQKLKSIKPYEENYTKCGVNQVNAINIENDIKENPNSDDKKIPNLQESAKDPNITELINSKKQISLCEDDIMPANEEEDDVPANESIVQKLSCNSESDFEEVVPLESIDSYILNLKQRRTKKEKQSNTLGNTISSQCEKWLASPGKNNGKGMSIEAETSDVSSENSSFNIELSDYESDDDNFQETLQNWQSEFEKNACSKLITTLSPKKSKKSKKIWKRESVKVTDDFEEMLK